MFKVGQQGFRLELGAQKSNLICFDRKKFIFKNM